MKRILKQNQCKRKGRFYKRPLSLCVITALLLNPISPLLSYLPGGIQQVEAYNLTGSPDFGDKKIMNKQVVELLERSGNWKHTMLEKWSVGENMKLTENENLKIVENTKNKSVISSMFITGKKGKGNWRAAFSDSTFDEKYITDDVQIAIIAYTYCTGENGYLSINPGTGKNFQFMNQKEWVQTDWMPYKSMDAVITGGEQTDIRSAYAVLADLTSPGEDGWQYEVTNNPEEGTPILWLRTDDLLRTAQGGSMEYGGGKKNIKLRLGIVPKNDPTAELTYVTAQAAGISDDYHGLGFQILADDWENCSGQDWQIVTMTDATKYESFEIRDSGSWIGNPSNLGKVGYTTADTCVTDLAGNGIYLRGLKDTNVRASNLMLDMTAPVVSRVKVSGSNIDSTSVTPSDQWPEDIDRSKLFSTAGDTVQFSLQLSEQVIALSEEEKKKIVLNTNLVGADGNPVTAGLSEILDSNADGSNGNIVSTLIFKPITITEGMTPQGVRIQATGVTNLHLLQDYCRNPMEKGTVDLTGLAPDIQNYLDTKGPTAELTEIIRGDKTDTEANYTVAFNVKDKEAGTLSAGVDGLEAKMALTSYENAPQMSYAYEVTRTAQAPEALTKTGCINGGGNVVWSSFSLTGEGGYYLHLKLTDIQDKELLDAEGLGISILLEDAAGNLAQSDLAMKSLEIDAIAPELTVIPDGTDIEKNGNSNKITFHGKAAASDRNGLDRMECQWTETGSEPAANQWTLVNIKSASSEEYSDVFATSFDSLTTVSRDLHVRVYDVYDNVTVKKITMTANPLRAAGQYKISGNPEIPSDCTDVMISKPLSTSGTTSNTAYTRAVVVMGEQTYVRVLDFTNDNGEAVSLMDKEADDWYQVKINDENGTYTEVIENSRPSWDSYYGLIRVTLYSSLTDNMIPQVGKELEDNSDSTGWQDAVLELKYASKNNDVYNVTFGGLTNAAGQNLGIAYYSIGDKRIPNTLVYKNLAGTRCSFQVSPYLMKNWGLEDMDFEQSYSVLVKADNEGTILEEEVSERIPLSKSTDQVFSAPAADKNGNAFTSGAYALKVHIAQKEGGVKDFYNSTRIVLDVSKRPARFGVFSYSANAQVARASGTLEWSRAASEGEALASVNLGVARPDRYGKSDSGGAESAERGNVVEVNGHPGYVAEVQNSLENAYSNGNFSFLLSAELPETLESCIGRELGKVQGIRYWNAASEGSPSQIEYEDCSSVTENGKTIYVVRISGSYGWYGEGSTVVSAEELKTTPVGDFKAALGSNTICYQLKMASGEESPVYQFQLNLLDQAPSLELSYSYGPTVLQVENQDGTDIYNRYTDYIDVTVENAFSPNGGVEIYRAYLQDNTWKYEKIPAGESIRLSTPADGYCGSASTIIPSYGRTNYIHEFICAVDSAGNIMSAYPATWGNFNNEQDEYYYHVTDNEAINGIRSKTCEITMGCSLEADGFCAVWLDSADWMTLEGVADSITVQVDDRAPYTLTDLKDQDFITANSAGIIGIENDGSNCLGKIRFVPPYDSAKEDGVAVEHTVKVTFSGKTDNTDKEPNLVTKTMKVSAPNTKPSLAWANAAAKPGQVGVVSNAYVREAGTKNSFAKAFDIQAYKNGAYTVTMEDPYGQKYEETLELMGMPDDPQVSISTKDFTREPVMVTVKSQVYKLGAVESELPEGTVIDGNKTNSLTLAVPENGSFSIYYASDGDPTASESREAVSITIDNIYNKEIKPAVEWVYAETAVPDDPDVTEYEMAAYESARAILVDENGSTLIDPRTGEAPVYIFVLGGETEYTFSGYVNEYGMEGPEFTATLPVELLPYPDSSAEEDIYSPDLALNGYSIRDGISTEIEAAYLKENALRPEDSDVGLFLYGENGNYEPENVFEDVDIFLKKFGWADFYLFNVDVADENAARLFVKEGADDEAPDYETGKSDSIPGVTLQGRTLQIEQNVEFTLFAVDEKGNSTSVYLEITNLGNQPQPGCVPVLTKNGNVRIYLLPPNVEGVSELRITNDNAKTEDDEKSPLFGTPYLPAAQNGTVTVYYSYVFEGENYTGSVNVEVSGIDENPPIEQKRTWSANYDEAGEHYTNQDISLQLQFDKALGEATLLDQDGLKIEPQSGVSVSWIADRVTIVFEGNIPERTKLKVKAAFNKKEAVIDIPAVTIIDKQEPTLSAGEVVYEANYKSASITLTADETGVILQENGKTGKIEGDTTVFTVPVKENGKFTYTGVDKGGNKASVTVSVTGLVTEELKLELSTKESEENIIDPETYKVSLGETLYARTNRTTKISVNGGNPVQAAAKTWIPVTISEDAEGLYPSVYAVDAYGNGTIVQLLRIPMTDRTAPKVLAVKSLLSVSGETSDEMLEKLFRSNLVCSDETTSSSALRIEFSYSREGDQQKLPVSYTVRDEAGNKTSGSFWLRLYDGTEPQVTVDGRSVTWDETILLDSKNPTITVTSNGERYKVDMKEGIKTTAQLKTGAVSVCGYTDETEKTLDVTVSKSGYYTFCITTQGRRSYRFVVYVEE